MFYCFVFGVYMQVRCIRENVPLLLLLNNMSTLFAKYRCFHFCAISGTPSVQRFGTGNV